MSDTKKTQQDRQTKNRFAKGRIFRDRFDWIAPFVKQGAVLDIGCIDERHPERIASAFHSKIRSINPRVVGADLDHAAIEKVRALGFTIVQANAETDPLGGPYDVILAGEMIEHLNNPGLFLDNARKHLNPKGVLLMTTPNPFYAYQFARIVKRGRPKAHPEHRFWFTPETLSCLLEKHQFEIVDFAWFSAQRGPIRNLLAKLRPYWNANFGVACAVRGS